MKDLWDKRYNTEEFIYGKEANAFFASRLALLAPGKLLLPGEGEGRNAVHAARAGWRVEAFDQSSIAAEKARSYAEEMGVSLDYRIKGIEEFSLPAELYDAVGLIYVHASSPLRTLLHSRVVQALKPGGTVILEAFDISQLGKATGGPGIPALLYTEEIIRADFAGLEIEILEQLPVILDEGSFHRGEAEVIRFCGKKTKV